MLGALTQDGGRPLIKSPNEIRPDREACLIKLFHYQKKGAEKKVSDFEMPHKRETFSV